MALFSQSGQILSLGRSTSVMLPVLKLFLLPSGYIAIADLDLDDGQFHEDSTGVFRNGFDRACLQRMFREAGFDDVSCRTATSMIKPIAGGGSQEFTVIRMIGRKK